MLTAQPPLVVIVGPTASGKTKIAIELARKYNGEIICADSRTVYRGLDIGTAKPTKQEKASVPHWGIDLVDPDETFTASDFKEYAVNKITDIRERNKTPFLVGGTGLYVDAVIFDYQFGPPPNHRLRKRLEEMSLEDLYEYSHKNNVKLPENFKNRRYVIRAIEQKSVNNKSRSTIIPNSIVVGISTDKDILRKRIVQRAEQLLLDGVVEEAKSLGKKYGWKTNSMSGNIYPLCNDYLRGVISADELKSGFIARDVSLAKRQMTWFRRNSGIAWMPLEDVKSYVGSRLDSE
jgi:tRNA dimethylallyltransferase